MASKTTVIDAALSLCGQPPIMHEQDESPNARTARLLFDFAFEATLRMHPWNFAIRREILSRVEGPPYEFKYYYQLPADCLRLMEMLPFGYRYVVEGQKLATDAPSAKVRYVSKKTSLADFDSTATKVLILELAKDMAPQLTADPGLRAQFGEEQAVLLRFAKNQSATENSPQRVIEGIWEHVR